MAVPCPNHRLHQHIHPHPWISGSSGMTRRILGYHHILSLIKRTKSFPHVFDRSLNRSPSTSITPLRDYSPFVIPGVVIPRPPLSLWRRLRQSFQTRSEVPDLVEVPSVILPVYVRTRSIGRQWGQSLVVRFSRTFNLKCSLSSLLGLLTQMGLDQINKIDDDPFFFQNFSFGSTMYFYFNTRIYEYEYWVLEV